MRYGLPYLGSKSRICNWLMDHLPSAENFVDLFAGGCAVAHCAMLSGKYRKFFVNDIQNDVIELFLSCIRRELPDDCRRSIGRLEFQTRKKDPFVRLVWSYSSNSFDYIYGQSFEDIKRTVHDMLVSDDYEERYALYHRFILLLERSQIPLHSLENVQSLVNLNALFAIAADERLRTMEIIPSSLDYADVSFPPGSTVYADPPYRQTQGYPTGMFDHARFYDWLRRTPFPVYVSEYEMPDDFVCIAELDHQGFNSKMITDRLFLHERFVSERLEQPNLF